MPPEEPKQQLLIIEEEIRPFIEFPGCVKCASKLGIKQPLSEGEGRVVVGPLQMEMTVWGCPRCDYTLPLPPGAFPKHSFKIVKTYGPQGAEGGPTDA